MTEFEVGLEDTNFVFETVMRVRTTEIGIGQHLDIEALVALLTESRARFLYAKSIKEINADYHGLMTTYVTTRVLSRARAREELLFEVGVQHLTPTGGEFAFKVTRMSDGSPVANAVMGFVAYDYRQNSEIPLSQSLRDALTSASL